MSTGLEDESSDGVDDLLPPSPPCASGRYYDCLSL
jgi:hypothetical protein